MLHASETRDGLLRNLERVFLSIGLVMTAIFMASLIQRVVGCHIELMRFRATKALPSAHLATAGAPLDFSLWSPQRLADYRQALTQHFDVPLAVLRISKVHLEVPVLEGTTDPVLNRGVGHISGTSLPGQNGTVGIAGHRDSFFRVLKDIGVGDTIELESKGGTYKYRVDQFLIVDPRDVSVLQPRKLPSLTLVTCYPFYFLGSAPKRYIVEASEFDSSLDRKTSTLTAPSNNNRQIAKAAQFEKDVPQNASRETSKSIQELSR